MSAVEFAEAVVVGDKDKGAVGIDASDGIHKHQVVASEGCGVEVGGDSIVDTYAEDNEVGLEHAEVGCEVVAA